MQMNDVDEQVLRQLCRSVEGQLLPEAVVDFYWRFKRLRDFVQGSPIEPDLLALIVLLAQGAPPAEPEVFSLPALVEVGAIKEGDALLVRWRNKEVEALYRELTARGAVVLLDGETSEREIEFDRILGQPAHANA